MSALPREDEALAALAAQGNDAAMAELIRRIMPLARAKATAYRGFAIPQEDLLQEGMLGFLNAVSRYEPNHGTSFRCFAAVCIQNRIVSALRAHTSGKHAPLNTSVTLADADGAQGANDPQDIISAKEEAAHLMSFLADSLSDLERKVLTLFLGGESYNSIASTLQTTPKAVDNALQRIRTKLSKRT